MQSLAQSVFLLCMALPLFAFQADEIAHHAKPDAKVCVAVVANATTTSAFVERMTERLTKSLKTSKIDVVSMDSATTMRHKLEPTAENGEESRAKNCDYTLLTRITDPRTNPQDQPGRISFGRRVPSIDASDPLGGSSGPVYREDLQVNFALFRPGRVKPVIDTRLFAEPAANVSDTLLPAMDREANRVSHELSKK